MVNLWQREDEISARPQSEEATHLPVTFGDAFHAAWAEGQLFSDSLAAINARSKAIDDYLTEAKAAGADIDAEMANRVNLAGDVSYSDRVAGANAAVGKLIQQHPEVEIQPLTDAGIEQRAIAASREARTNYEQIAAREKTFSGKVGMFAGGAAATTVDPINIPALVIAPEAEIGVLGSALLWGGYGIASQAVNEAMGVRFREQVQPGYIASGEPISNVIGAGATGAIGGGGLKVLGNVWTRLSTGAWPQSVRDAGNVVASHANLLSSNVLPGAQGEAAHFQAMAGTIDQILNGQRVDPSIFLQSRNLVARLEREAPFNLPIINEPAIRLIGQEAELRTRAGELDQALGFMPKGDQAAADRLNRLRAIEAQMESASSPTERAALFERRDQILVDTNPEELQKGAAPFEARRRLEAEREQVNTRLNEIAAQRAQLAPIDTPSVVGQRMPAAPSLFDIHTGRIDAVMDMRTRAGEIATRAVGERAAELGVAQLPFQAGMLDQLHDFHVQSIADSVKVLGRFSGYDMPAAEARGIADRVVGAKTNDEARTILNQISDRPRTLLDTLPSSADFARAARLDAETAEATVRITQRPELVAQALAAPQHETAIRADIDRVRAAGDIKIPAGIDADGNPVMRSLDDAMNEVDSYKFAADQIAACASSAVVAAEAA